MKLECIKEQVMKALAITEKITNTNTTLPILQCVLLEAKNNLLTIHSTNLELGIEVTVPVKIEKDGKVAVPASVLYNTLQSTMDSSISLFVNNNNLIIKTKHSDTIIHTYESEDFPSIPTIKDKTIYTFKTDELIRGIQSVIYSASTSVIKPELSSVYIYEEDNKTYFVSTDSFRLAEKIIIKKKKNTAPSFLLPLRNAIELLRILNQMEQDMDIAVKINENQVSFEFDNVFVTSRLIDGVFPDYKQIIPKETTTEVVVLKQDLLNIFKKINIFTDKFGQVSINIEPKKKLFTLSAKNSAVGETKDAIDAVIKGEQIDMRFNFRYIFESLSSVHPDSILLLFSGIGKPLIMKGVSDESFLYLVMPMNK